MEPCRIIFVFLSVVLGLNFVVSLKCRGSETTLPVEDMEYAVRQCVRQFLTPNKTKELKQENDPYATIMNWGKNNFPGECCDGRPPSREQRDKETKGNYREDPHREEGDRGWDRRRPNRDFMAPSPSDRRPYRHGYQPQVEQEDEDYPVTESARRRQRGKDRPHSNGQQSQFDKDVVHSYNQHKQLFQGNNNNNKNKNNNANNNNNSNRDQPPALEGSPLSNFDPCLIHCVFQELTLIDDRGQLNKQSVTTQLTRRLRNRELREFLQETIEDCFDSSEDERFQGKFNGGKEDNVCQKSKIFAICLEERGKDACEDWDDPVISPETNPMKVDNKMNNDGKQVPNNNNNNNNNNNRNNSGNSYNFNRGG